MSRAPARLRRFAAIMSAVAGAALAVAPAAHAAGPGTFNRVTGTALGSATEGSWESCPVDVYPQERVAWEVTYEKAPARTLSVSGCTTWRGSMGGTPFAGTFTLRAPEGELHGTMTGAKGYGSRHDHFTMTLHVTDGTRGLRQMRGDLVFDGCELRTQPVSPVDAAAVTTPDAYRWTPCPEVR